MSLEQSVGACTGALDQGFSKYLLNIINIDVATLKRLFLHILLHVICYFPARPVCVPTVCGGRRVPSACGGVCSPVCWRSESAHWPLRLLQMSPPRCRWYGYCSGYCEEGKQERRMKKNTHGWFQFWPTITVFSVWPLYDFLTTTCDALYPLCL